MVRPSPRGDYLFVAWIGQGKGLLEKVRRMSWMVNWRFWNYREGLVGRWITTLLEKI